MAVVHDQAEERGGGETQGWAGESVFLVFLVLQWCVYILPHPHYNYIDNIDTAS